LWLKWFLWTFVAYVVWLWLASTFRKCGKLPVQLANSLRFLTCWNPDKRRRVRGYFHQLCLSFLKMRLWNKIGKIRGIHVVHILHLHALRWIKHLTTFIVLRMIRINFWKSAEIMNNPRFKLIYSRSRKTFATLIANPCHHFCLPFYFHLSKRNI